jgi:hypothetical protein
MKRVFKMPLSKGNGTSLLMTDSQEGNKADEKRTGRGEKKKRENNMSKKNIKK